MKIAGFWARTCAFALDVAILFLFGQLLGLVAFDALVRLGNWGWLLGLGISSAYFGLFDSRVAGGQTPGKRLLRLVVRDLHGQPLSLACSTGRYLVIGLPWMLFGVAPGTASTWVSVLLSLLVFGLGAALLYLALFNRRQGRSLHDWLFASVVVKTSLQDDTPRPRAWRGHVYVVAGLLLLSLLLPALFAPLTRTPLLLELTRVQTVVSQVPGVRSCSVSEGQRGKPEPDSPPPVVFWQVNAGVDSRAQLTPAFSAQLAHAVLQASPQAGTRAALVIALQYGYHIGIATYGQQYVFIHTPAEWRQL